MNSPIFRQRFELEIGCWPAHQILVHRIDIHCPGLSDPLDSYICTGSSTEPWRLTKQMKSSKQPQTLAEFIWHWSHCANKTQTNRKTFHLLESRKIKPCLFDQQSKNRSALTSSMHTNCMHSMNEPSRKLGTGRGRLVDKPPTWTGF